MRAMRSPWFPNATQAHLSLWRDHAERRESVLEPYRDRPEAQTRTRLTETSLCSASGDSLLGSALLKPPRRSSQRTRFRRPSSLKQTLRLTQSSDDQTEASAETPCRTAQSAYSQILSLQPSPVRLPSVASSRRASCRAHQAGTRRSSRPQSQEPEQRTNSRKVLDNQSCIVDSPCKQGVSSEVVLVDLELLPRRNPEKAETTSLQPAAIRPKDPQSLGGAAIKNSFHYRCATFCFNVALQRGSHQSVRKAS